MVNTSHNSREISREELRELEVVYIKLVEAGVKILGGDPRRVRDVILALKRESHEQVFHMTPFHAAHVFARREFPCLPESKEHKQFIRAAESIIPKQFRSRDTMAWFGLGR